MTFVSRKRKHWGAHCSFFAG